MKAQPVKQMNETVQMKIECIFTSIGMIFSTISTNARIKLKSTANLICAQSAISVITKTDHSHRT